MVLLEKKRCVYARPFSYWGSKVKLCPKIVDLASKMIGPNKNKIISPFCGCAVVELNLAHRWPDKEIVCYDINRHIINFHKHVQQNLQGLQLLIKELLRRDVSKALYQTIFLRMKGRTLQDAADWWYCSYFSFNGKVGSFSASTRPNKINIKPYPKNIRFIHRDSLSALERLPTPEWKHIFMYVDPPYMLNRQGIVYIRASKENQQYLNHKRLFDVLQKCRLHGGSWILSYGCDSNITMYKKFKIIRVKVRTVKWERSTATQKQLMLHEYLILSK